MLKTCFFPRKQKRGTVWHRPSTSVRTVPYWRSTLRHEGLSTALILIVPYFTVRSAVRGCQYGTESVRGRGGVASKYSANQTLPLCSINVTFQTATLIGAGAGILFHIAVLLVLLLALHHEYLCLLSVLSIPLYASLLVLRGDRRVKVYALFSSLNVSLRAEH